MSTACNRKTAVRWQLSMFCIAVSPGQVALSTPHLLQFCGLNGLRFHMMWTCDYTTLVRIEMYNHMLRKVDIGTHIMWTPHNSQVLPRQLNFLVAKPALRGIGRFWCCISQGSMSDIHYPLNPLSICFGCLWSTGKLPGIPLNGTSSSRDSTRGKNHSHVHHLYGFESLRGQDLSLSANIFVTL